MRKILLPWAAGLGTVITLMLGSCAYDPYYSSAGGYYGGGYSSGGGYFGDGYGYGNSSFSTSLFVSTGDPRWGYDPYSYCYYDYRSRRYYDPYLYGYYPVGYRPYAVYGAPHPHGWRPGSGYCPPPRTVRDVTVANYRNRESAYRNSNYSWARQVKHRPAQDSHRQPGNTSRPYSGRQTDYRTDSRTRQTIDRNSYNSQTRSQQETSRTRGYTPDSRGSREVSRPNSRSSTQQIVQPEYRPSSRQTYRETPRIQSADQPRRERPTEMRSHGGSPRMREAPPSTPPAKQNDSDRSSDKHGRGLRSLGNA